MVRNHQQQLYRRQQAAIAAAKQAKKNIRKGKQLDTRRTQRDAELARREEKKRAAAAGQDLYRSNQVRLANSIR
jgi:hypothetical protein